MNEQNPPIIRSFPFTSHPFPRAEDFCSHLRQDVKHSHTVFKEDHPSFKITPVTSPSKVLHSHTDSISILKQCSGHAPSNARKTAYIGSPAKGELHGFLNPETNTFFSLKCLRLVESGNVCSNCQDLRRYEDVSVGPIPTSRTDSTHQHFLKYPFIDAVPDVGKELAADVMTLFKAHPEDWKKQRYLRLLRLSILYGKKLLEIESCFKLDPTSKKKNKVHIKWTKEFPQEFHLLVSLLSNIGEKRALDFRGRIDEGLLYAHFPFPDPTKIYKYYSRYIPKTLTIKGCNSVKVEVAKHMIANLPSGTPLEIMGASCDAIDICKKTEFINGRVVGYGIDMTVREFMNMSANEAMSKQASKIMQFFLVIPNENIKMCIPIHSFPCGNSTSASQVVEWIKYIEQDLSTEKRPVKMKWLSADGDMEDLEKELEKYGILLFRDTDHVAKVGRNAIITNTIQFKEREPVSLSLFYSLSMFDSKFKAVAQQILKFHSPIPRSYELLRMDPVKRLTNYELVKIMINWTVKELCNSEEEAGDGHCDAETQRIRDLGQYVGILHCTLYLFEFCKTKNLMYATIEERADFILNNINDLKMNSRSHFKKQIKSLISNIKQLKQFAAEHNIPVHYPLLVTRMVENYFSVIRRTAQNPNPTVSEYMRCSTKAMIELAKSHAQDLIFFPIYPSEDEIVGSYNKVSGMMISFRDLINALDVTVGNHPELFSKIEVGELTSIQLAYKRTIELNSSASMRTKSLSQTFYSELYTEQDDGKFIHNLVIVNKFLLCDVCSKRFIYPASFESHVKTHKPGDDIVSGLPVVICNFVLFPCKSDNIRSKGHGIRFLPFQHPIERKHNQSISDNEPPTSFEELIKNFDSNIVLNTKYYAPKYFFNKNWNEPTTIRDVPIMIFADCETQAWKVDPLVDGKKQHIQPITFSLYCVNDGQSIYIKMRPEKVEYHHYSQGVHGITVNQINSLHKDMPVTKGISTLLDWIIERTSTDSQEVYLFAHNCSFERKAISENCSKEDKRFVRIKFIDTIKILKTEQNNVTNPLNILCKNTERQWNIFLMKFPTKKASYSLDAIAARYGLGRETHNAADDTLFLLVVLIIFFKCLSPDALIKRLYEYIKTQSTVTGKRKNRPIPSIEIPALGDEGEEDFLEEDFVDHNIENCGNIIKALKSTQTGSQQSELREELAHWISLFDCISFTLVETQKCDLYGAVALHLSVERNCKISAGDVKAKFLDFVLEGALDSICLTDYEKGAVISCWMDNNVSLNQDVLEEYTIMLLAKLFSLRFVIATAGEKIDCGVYEETLHLIRWDFNDYHLIVPNQEPKIVVVKSADYISHKTQPISPTKRAKP